MLNNMEIGLASEFLVFFRLAILLEHEFRFEHNMFPTDLRFE